MSIRTLLIFLTEKYCMAKCTYDTIHWSINVNRNKNRWWENCNSNAVIELKGQQILLINYIAMVWLFFSAVIIYDINVMAVKFLKYLFDIAKKTPKIVWVDWFFNDFNSILAKRFAVCDMIGDMNLDAFRFEDTDCS